ncbi:MAG: sigma factor [Armatimonadota bacterium]|nr:sigma factor [Armatimonadota bacterium]
MSQPAQLVESYLPLVRAIARMVARRLPSTVDRGDLIGDGMVGLMEAAHRYDPHTVAWGSAPTPATGSVERSTTVCGRGISCHARPAAPCE